MIIHIFKSKSVKNINTVTNELLVQNGFFTHYSEVIQKVDTLQRLYPNDFVYATFANSDNVENIIIVCAVMKITFNDIDETIESDVVHMSLEMLSDVIDDTQRYFGDYAKVTYSFVDSDYDKPTTATF